MLWWVLLTGIFVFAQDLLWVHINLQTWFDISSDENVAWISYIDIGAVFEIKWHDLAQIMLLSHVIAKLCYCLELICESALNKMLDKSRCSLQLYHCWNSGCQLDEPQLLWQPPEEYICEMIL